MNEDAIELGALVMAQAQMVKELVRAYGSEAMWQSSDTAVPAKNAVAAALAASARLSAAVAAQFPEEES